MLENIKRSDIGLRLLQSMTDAVEGRRRFCNYGIGRIKGSSLSHMLFILAARLSSHDHCRVKSDE